MAASSLPLKRSWAERSIPTLASERVRQYVEFTKTYKGMMAGMGGDREEQARNARPQGTSVIVMTAGKPDKELLPYDDLMEFAKKAWGISRPAPLEYGTSDKLKEEIAKYLSKSRGTEVAPNEIFISSGNGGGLRNVFQAYLSPGDIAIVESPLWTITVNLMKQCGANILPVGIDKDGILVNEVEQQIASAERDGLRIKMIYLQPLNHNPTGATITRARAERLLSLAAQHGIVIVCDEAYEPYWYGEQPCFMSAMSEGYGVLTVHTFSKTLGTGLRLGYVHAKPEFLQPMQEIKGIEGSIFLEYTVGELMETGRFEELITKNKSVYTSKLNVFCEALKTHVGRHLAIPPSASGGFFVWLELARLPAVEVNLQMLMRGVEARVGGNMYGPDHPELSSTGSASGCHLGFAFIGPTEDELVEAARRIGEACDAVEAQLASKL